VAPVGALPEVVGDLSRELIFRSSAPADIAAGLIAALRGRLPDEAACRAYARVRFGVAQSAAAVASVYREAARCPAS